MLRCCGSGRRGARGAAATCGTLVSHLAAAAGRLALCAPLMALCVKMLEKLMLTVCSYCSSSSSDMVSPPSSTAKALATIAAVIALRRIGA